LDSLPFITIKKIQQCYSKARLNSYVLANVECIMHFNLLILTFFIYLNSWLVLFMCFEFNLDFSFNHFPIKINS